LSARLCAPRQPAFRAKQIAEWIYAKRVRRLRGDDESPGRAARSNSPRSLSSTICSRCACSAPRIDAQVSVPPRDGALIESVLIPASPALYGEASTAGRLCISTQVGCAYGCKFCASGLDGWSRNLTAAEIVDQVLRSRN
jgi:23S rRNA (adenine2503-C2)-methyltransferase